MENPIDKDKISEKPSTLPYAHHVGSALVKPTEKGVIRSRAMSSMQEQTAIQLAQIKKQIELLAEQARRIQKRIEVSEKIYQADIGFEPTAGHIYHLYEKEDGTWLLSLLSPVEWGSKNKNQYVSSVRLMADHTWELL